MNSLENYQKFRPGMRGGDIIAFGGTGFVSNGIKFVTRGSASHVAVVLESQLLIDGQAQDGRILSIIESTTLTGRKGVQINRLSDRIAGYDDGATIDWLPLSDQIRGMLNWPAAWAYALKCRHDAVGYNYGEIAAYVARLVPFLSYIPYFHKPNPHEVVCSEFCTEFFRAGGLPGLDAYETSPTKLEEMRLFREQVQLCGKPHTIRNFNTV